MPWPSPGAGVPAPSKILRDEFTADELWSVLDEWLEAYDQGWTPRIHLPRFRDQRAEKIRAALAERAARE